MDKAQVQKEREAFLLQAQRLRQTIEDVFKKTGFDDWHEVLTDGMDSDAYTPDLGQECEEYTHAFENLYDVLSDLRYLSLPVIREGIIEEMDGSIFLDGSQIHCGDTVDYFIEGDGYAGRGRWVSTAIEKGDEYYFKKRPRDAVIGARARIRG